MARARKAAAPPDPLKPPPRAQCAAVVERFLKEGQTIYWAREMPTFYKLWKLYPDLAFWQGYQLPFGDGTHALNMMSWFEGDGAPDLARAWLLFKWTPPEPAPEPPPLDDQPPTQLSYPIAPRKPRTVAEWLGAKPPSARSTP